MPPFVASVARPMCAPTPSRSGPRAESPSSSSSAPAWMPCGPRRRRAG